MKVNAMDQKFALNVVVNNGGNMDLETNGFTSDVSLPKEKANKTRAMVNKLELSNWQNYKRTAMLIMQQESNMFNCVGNTTKQVDRLSINIYLLIIHLRMGYPARTLWY